MKKTILKVTLFIIILIIIVFFIQNWLIKKFPDQTNTVPGFYSLDDNEIDTLFLGSSHMYFAVSPIEIYKNNRIKSYNLGTPSQTIASSYYLAEEAFQTQDLDVVVLDAGAMFFDDELSKVTEDVIDSLHFSKNKVNATIDYSSKTKKQFLRCFFARMFPIYVYHGSWNSLTEISFKDKGMVDEDNFLKGYYMSTNARGYEGNVKYMNLHIEEAKKYAPNAYCSVICEENKEYLRKINELCKRNDCHLLLTKIPGVATYLQYPTVWSYERYSMIKELCDEEDIAYLDLTYEEDLEIDYAQDYSDGVHCNLWGATKISRYLGDYISREYSLNKDDNEKYKKNVIKYNMISEVANLELTQKSSEYFEYLQKNLNGKIIVISGYSDIMGGMTEEEKKFLSGMGLRKIGDKYKNNAYVAILDDGKVVVERADPLEISTKYHLDNQKDEFDVYSSGYWKYSAVASTLSLNDNPENLLCCYEGMNIAVFDKESGLQIDKVNFNTSAIVNEDEEHMALRDGADMIKNRFVEYQNWVNKNK